MVVTKLKDIYKGERCFVLGNAQSLLRHDLLKLQNEKTFVTNYFPLHPQFDDIKPTFYCMHDVWEYWEDSELGSQTYNELTTKSLRTIKFFPNSFRKKLKELFPSHNIYYLDTGGPPIWRIGKVKLDISASMMIGGSIITDFCLPIAFYMGFSRIYLIGFDCDYIVEGDYQLNHFLGPMLKANWILGDLKSWYDNELEHMLKSLEIIKNSFESKGRQRSEERRVGKECRSRWSPYH